MVTVTLPVSILVLLKIPSPFKTVWVFTQLLLSMLKYSSILQLTSWWLTNTLYIGKQFNFAFCHGSSQRKYHTYFCSVSIKSQSIHDPTFLYYQCLPLGTWYTGHRKLQWKKKHVFIFKKDVLHKLNNVCWVLENFIMMLSILTLLSHCYSPSIFLSLSFFSFFLSKLSLCC